MITIRLKTAIAVIVPGFCLSIGIAGVLQGILVDRLTHCRTRCLCLCGCYCIRCLCCFHPTLGSGLYCCRRIACECLGCACQICSCLCCFCGLYCSRSPSQ